MNKNLALVVLALAVVGFIGGVLLFAGSQPGTEGQDQVKKFNSYEELTDFLKTSREKLSYSGGFYGGFGSFGMVVQKAASMGAPVMATTAVAESVAYGPAATDYSTTNIQVEGVDEADIVKNDGKYIYTIVGNKLVIVDAYPAENARIVSEVALKGNPTEIFVNNDKLVVFAHDYSYNTQAVEETQGIPTTTAVKAVKPYSGTKTRMDVYDVSDREEPRLTRSVVVSGSYHDSRMIGDYVYAIVNQPVYYYGGEEPVPLPAVAEDGNSREVPASDIYYFDYPDSSYNYVNILSLNTQDDSEDYNIKTFLAGSAQNTYVSLGSIYLTYTKWNIYTADNITDEVVIPAVPNNVGVKIRQIRESAAAADEKVRQISEELNSYISSLSSEENAKLQQKTQQLMVEFEKELAKQQEQTVVHKIAISNDAIDYKGQGSVPGRILNQFSMDEHNGYFRIATTTASSLSSISSLSITPQVTTISMPSTMPTMPMPNPPTMQQPIQPTTQNNVYVLDGDLRIVGAVEDLAPGESIHSARFMGDRAYMVTFKKVDPLFVIDLSEPTQPKVLGKLKIPGYSDYLHPYDEDHIIGLGKEAVEAEQGDFAWYQGIKIALFDVSDPENPREISKYNIGDRGTDSYALQDHKAFLFSRQKNLLVIPIQLAEIDESRYLGGELPPNAYGDFVWQGAYIFSLDTENGFDLKGRVTHLDTEEGNQQMLKSGYYFRSDYNVKRSLYMDDVLYTLSDRMIKMNDLEDLEEVNRVRLPNSRSDYGRLP